jgi:membrane protein YdbS with pleckstrin-like domain
MYCHQCGTDIQDHAQFCSSCGKSQEAGGPRSTTPAPHALDASGEPLFSLHPVFVPSIQMLGHIPIFLFLGIWGGLFFGGFSQVFLQFVDVGIPTWVPFVFFGAVFALVLPFVSYRVNRKTYERTEYTFYPDKLDYYEGFFTVEEKTIALHRVTEVNLRKGIFQSKHGLGTILLSTPATSAGTGRASAGIRIHDVENPDENYQRIKELVERSQLPRHRMAA